MIAREIHSLDETDKELLRIKLEQPAISYSQLSGKLGMSLGQVYKRCKEEIFQKALTEYQKHAIDIVRDAKQQAARKLVKLINSTDDRVALNACLAICADVLPGTKFSVNHSGGMTVSYKDMRSSIQEKLNRLSETTVAEDGTLEGKGINIIELARGNELNDSGTN